jgi:hypothetical protein
MRVLEDVSAGAWIAPRRGGAFGAVTLEVPGGYHAYARICHPATDREGNPASWREVARATGRRAHPLMQWHALVNAADPLDMSDSGLWKGENPDYGNLPPRQLAALCELLAEQTARSDRCFFALWDGYGGLETYGWRSDAATGSDAADTNPSRHVFSTQELSRPRLRLPHRDYLVLAGALHDAGRICSWVGDHPFAQSPNLFWQADQAWFVASEIDFDSTLVGGPTSLIEAILHTPELDAWPVEPDDSLASYADRINLTPSDSDGEAPTRD